MANKYDEAGRAIAGLLTYNPGPGIYSRLERAIQQMPENVRAQELPGLLKRYKDGVPGWELKETDLDSVIAGRDVVPREELLARVKERSPVYTHGEVILGGRPQMKSVVREPFAEGTDPEFQVSVPVVVRAPDYQFPDTGEVSRLGQGVSHGEPKYQTYGQGGDDYAELLLTQPRVGGDYGSHWSGDTKDAVAHARFDTHGDALRINELQSDLGIHNRKAREAAANSRPVPERRPNEPVGAYEERLRANGFDIEWDRDGGMKISEPDRSLPFPLEDAWADLLIKRLALESAQKGHRAIEVASPSSVFAKTGNRRDEAASRARMEHFYGKVVPGALERLGKKMGGMSERAVPEYAPDIGEGWKQDASRLNSEVADYERAALWRPEVVGYGERPPAALQNWFGMLVDTLENAPDARGAVGDGQQMFEALQQSTGMSAADAAKIMPEIMYNAQRAAEAQAAYRVAHHRGAQYGAAQSAPPGRRYLMSDEMRRRILQEGIPAAVAIGIGADNLIDRLDREQR